MVKASPGAWRVHDKKMRRRQAIHNSSRAGSLLAFVAMLATDPTFAASLSDSVNRTVEISADITAVVPAGPPAQVLLEALAPDKLAGLVEPFKPADVIYVDRRVAELPQIPMLNRTSAPGDIAMVSALKPGLVVDYGNASARYAATDQKIQKELGVPAVLFGGKLGDAGRVATILGAAIGEVERGKAIAATAEDVLGRAKPLADLSDSDRIAVYLGRGSEGLIAPRSGTSFDEAVRLAGGRNVVEGGNGTFKHMSVEEVVALKPAFVVFSDRDALKSPLRAALPPGTRIVLDTGEPYKVLTGPPSINRLVGVAALALLLHPDKFRMEPEDVTRVEAKLFPVPPGLALPAPLQEVR